MNKKVGELLYQGLVKQCEYKLAIYKAEGRCAQCEILFQEPEKEFKVLKNPLTGETKRSMFCNSYRLILRKRFDEEMKKYKKEGNNG